MALVRSSCGRTGATTACLVLEIRELRGQVDAFLHCCCHPSPVPLSCLIPAGGVDQHYLGPRRVQASSSHLELWPEVGGFGLVFLTA